MAGLGRKVFNSGDILLASEVQGFLQDQSVMVFEDDAARGSAIATPTEGMVTFRKDDNALEVFDGSVFAPIGSSPGLVHIESQTFSAVSAVSFSNDVFNSTFQNYFVTYNLTNSSSFSLSLRLRASATDASGSNYNRQTVFGASTTAAASPAINATSFSLRESNRNRHFGTIELFDPFEALVTKILAKCMNIDTALTNPVMILAGGGHTLTTSHDSMSLLASTGTMTGTMAVYGVKT